MPNSARRRNSENRNSPDTTADTNRTLLSANLIEWWKGGQAEQAAWLYGRIKAAEDDYGFYQLDTTGAAPITTEILFWSVVRVVSKTSPYSRQAVIRIDGA